MFYMDPQNHFLIRLNLSFLAHASMSDDDTSVSEGEMELGSEDEGDMPYKPPAGQTKKISEAISKTPARSNKPPKRSAAGSTTSYDEKSHSEDEKEGVATPIQKPGAYREGEQISGCQIGKNKSPFCLEGKRTIRSLI